MGPYHLRFIDGKTDVCKNYVAKVLTISQEVRLVLSDSKALTHSAMEIKGERDLLGQMM